MTDAKIHHVSDTALWVATYRAQESERPDAVFKDPYARKLAGERGAAIAATLPRLSATAMAFAMVTRTTAIDRLVEAAVADGVDTVINLGAGLDTRPYRMALPAQLRWIEVDFPHMIAYKNEQLADAVPVCRLERIAADLADDEARRALLARLGSETRKALVITEGVVAYLTDAQAATLSQDLFAVPSFRYWIMDYARGKRRKWGQKRTDKVLEESPTRFEVEEPLPFFARQGWTVTRDIGMLDEAERLGRRLPFMFPWSLLAALAPGWVRAQGNKTYGFVMFGRPESPRGPS